MGGKAWTDDEISALVCLVQTHTPQEIADEFNRSVSAVYYKIRELKEKGDIE